MDRYDYEKDRICGLDMHWYAVDRDGYIGEFWTCGELPIPGRISHNDLERIEYYADVLFNQEDLIKKPCGSRTKLAFYGYDGNDDGTTWEYPYAQVESPEHPMKVDELPEEIRQSLITRQLKTSGQKGTRVSREVEYFFQQHSQSRRPEHAVSCHRPTQGPIDRQFAK